jgi:hypothetical protein
VALLRECRLGYGTVGEMGSMEAVNTMYVVEWGCVLSHGGIRLLVYLEGEQGRHVFYDICVPGLCAALDCSRGEVNSCGRLA